LGYEDTSSAIQNKSCCGPEPRSKRHPDFPPSNERCDATTQGAVTIQPAFARRPEITQVANGAGSNIADHLRLAQCRRSPISHPAPNSRAEVRAPREGRQTESRTEAVCVTMRALQSSPQAAGNLLEPVLDVVLDPVRIPQLHRIHFHPAHLHGEVQVIAAGQTG
jgi:hypothetical protein